MLMTVMMMMMTMMRVVKLLLLQKTVMMTVLHVLMAPVVTGGTPSTNGISSIQRPSVGGCF